MSENVSVDMSQHFYRASAADFMKIPGSPVAYWVSEGTYKVFAESPKWEEKSNARQGLATADNNRFLRLWFEVSFKNIGLNFENRSEAQKSNLTWFPYNKGGEFRKWYGNQEYLVNWKNDGEELFSFRPRSVIRNPDCYFKESISWSDVTSSKNAFRYYPHGFIHDSCGHSIFDLDRKKIKKALSFCNNHFASTVIKVLNPTLHFHIGYFNSLPYPLKLKDENLSYVNWLISESKKDWNSYETSWDFSFLPLLAKHTKQHTLSSSYKTLRANWLASTLEMQRLEKENNRIFIDAYGLEDELTPDVPLNEITLTCNPHYRYRGDLTEQEREDRLQSDTIAELISYAIGCMMGRYSLDKEGLVYAHEHNNGFAELVAEGAYKSFPADSDGILALTAEEWFEEDIANRFSEFLTQVWGEESLQQNIDFVAQSLCLYALKARSGETSMEVIRRYLSTQFFKDHMSMYKRRPIYWLFSSGRHKAFECVVYLHRYNESTLARMRTEYVIPHTSRLSAYATRLAARIEVADSTAERNRLNREQKKTHDQQAELAAFDEQLRHAADQRIQLDLDDGVKVNYGKFGDLLAEVRAIAGK